MTNTLSEKIVLQDGPDFYDQDGKPITTYPRCVFDGDLEAAKAARVWFTDVFCPKEGIDPKFE